MKGAGTKTADFFPEWYHVEPVPLLSEDMPMAGGCWGLIGGIARFG